MKLIRLSTLVFSTFVLFFSVGISLYAQTSSDKTTTRVGNPTSNPPSGGGSAPPTGDPRQAMIDEFDITMEGFSGEHLTWAREKLWEVSNTKFIDLVRGTTIQAVSSGSHQKGCRGSHSSGVDVDLQQFPQEFFKFLLIHELGHIVRNCNDRATIQYDEHINAHNSEGGVSYYGNNASSCTGSDNLSEDYADMIAYYLSPSAGLSTVSCDPIQNRPNPFFSKNPTDFPTHLKVAQTVLNR